MLYTKLGNKNKMCKIETNTLEEFLMSERKLQLEAELKEFM